MHVGANVDMWLSCSEKDKANYFHDHCEFNKGCCVAMIDPEGRHHDFSRFSVINGFSPSNKRSATTTGMISSDCIAHFRTSIKTTRCADATINSNYGILNVRLVKDLNYLMTGDTRSEMSRRSCALYRWTT